jgi:hypothetical protein
MTEHSLSPEQIARLPCCADIVAAKGASSRYAADCVVRAYQGRHLADLCRDAGMPCDEATVVTIAAGIGILRMTWTGNQFTSGGSVRANIRMQSVQPEASPQPLPASDDLRIARLGVCRACSHLASDRCAVAGCACAGLGQPANRFSRCPIGKW